MPANYNPHARKVLSLDLSATTTVLAGQTEDISVTPPTGKIYNLISAYLRCSPPTGATSGKHRFEIFSMNIAGVGIYAESDYATEVKVANNCIKTANVDKMPDTTGDISGAFRTIFGTNSNPFTIKYYNNTDADQSNTRYIRLIVEQFDERLD